MDSMRFDKYIDRVMSEDEWYGDRPQVGDVVWADKVIAYIEWLRERSEALKTYKPVWTR